MTTRNITEFESLVREDERVDRGQYLMTTSRRTQLIFPQGTQVHDTTINKHFDGDGETQGGRNDEGGTVEFALNSGGLTGTSENVSVEINDVGDDRAVHIYGGELSVGTPQDPREAVFGGGDSYPAPIAFHCTEANTTGLTITGAINITDILQSDTGSTVGLYGGTEVGRFILVGSDYPYLGTKMKIADGGSVDPNNVRLESWIGDGVYNHVSYMASNANYPHTQTGNSFGNYPSEQWRFGFDPTQPSTWAPLTLNINGVDITKYWGRMTVETPIVADPVIEQLKCHTSRAEINATGTLEFFGLARYPKTLQAGLQILTPNALIDPADESVTYGSGTTAKYVDNELQNNRDDGFLIIQGIQDGLDTSIPLFLNLSYYIKGTGTGDVVFDIDVYQVGDGFVYDGNAIPDTYSITDSILTDVNEVRRSVKFKLDAEKLMPGEAIVISIKRNGDTNPADTHPDSVVMTYASLTGFFWR